MMRRLVGIVLFGASSACGGSTDAPRPTAQACRPIPDFVAEFGPDDGGKAADCHALDGYELYPLNDFEGAHNVNWYVNSDRTALQTPPPDSQGLPTTPIPGGRCVGAMLGAQAPTLCSDSTAERGACTGEYVPDSWAAVEIRSGNLTNNGGTLGNNRQKVGCITPVANDPSTVCHFQQGPPEVGPCSAGEGPSPPAMDCRAVENFSSWDGIVFWGRIGPGSESAIRVRASDPYTDDKNCICNPYTNQNDASDGCDKFGAYAELDRNFRAVFVRFDEMQQGGWGLPRQSLDTSNIFEIVFEYNRGIWDLWIDDVALFRSRQ